MNASQCEVIQTTLAYYTFSHHVSVAVLLQFVVVRCKFDLITHFLYVGPASFNVHSVIKRELFMNHSETVIGPQMIKSICRQFAGTGVQITIRHVTIAENCSPLHNMSFHYRNTDRNTFVSHNHIYFY